MEANKIVLLNSSIFKNNFSENFICSLIPLIKELHLNPNELIF